MMRSADFIWTGQQASKTIRADVASTVLERLSGWLPKKTLKPEDALWIEACGSVHTFFMRMSIDVVFVSREGQVLKVTHNLKPWKMCWGGGRAVLELPAGCAQRLGIQLGDTLKMDIRKDGA